MKKIIIAVALTTVFSATASAKNWNDYVEKDEGRREITTAVSVGQIDVLGFKVNKFGVDVSESVKEDEIGLSLGMGIGMLGEDLSEGMGLDYMNLIDAHVGLSYGLTDNLSFVPTVGGSLLKTDFSEDLGYNVGADLLYSTPKGFTAGLGVRFHSIEGVDFEEFNFKIGHSF